MVWVWAIDCMYRAQITIHEYGRPLESNWYMYNAIVKTVKAVIGVCVVATARSFDASDGTVRAQSGSQVSAVSVGGPY